MTSKRRGSITAAELMAQLEADEEYCRRRDAYAAKVEAEAKIMEAAEVPIVADLNAAGFPVASVWDLVNMPMSYPAAWPILIEHLERGGYPDRVMESLGRALAVPESVAYWDRLTKLYRSPRNPGEEDGVAVALRRALPKPNSMIWSRCCWTRPATTVDCTSFAPFSPWAVSEVAT